MPRSVSTYPECHMMIIWSKFVANNPENEKKLLFLPNISVINDFLG